MLSIVYLYALLLCCLLYVNHDACYWCPYFVCSCPTDSENQASVSCSPQEGMQNPRPPLWFILLVYWNILEQWFWNCFILIQRSNLCALLWCRINILERGFRRWSKRGRNTWNTCEEPTGIRTVLFCQSWGSAMCPSTKLLTTRAKQPPRPNLRRARARARRERWRHRSGEQIRPFWPWIAHGQKMNREDPQPPDGSTQSCNVVFFIWICL